jgi:hypothetical protein
MGLDIQKRSETLLRMLSTLEGEYGPNCDGSYWWLDHPLVCEVSKWVHTSNSGCWLWFGNTDTNINDRPMLIIDGCKVNIKLALFNLIHCLDFDGTVKSSCKNDCVQPLHLRSPGLPQGRSQGKWGAGSLKCLGCGRMFDTWSSTYNRHCFRCSNRLAQGVPTEGERDE